MPQHWPNLPLLDVLKPYAPMRYARQFAELLSVAFGLQAGVAQFNLTGVGNSYFASSSKLRAVAEPGQDLPLRSQVIQYDIAINVSYGSISFYGEQASSMPETTT